MWKRTFFKEIVKWAASRKVCKCIERESTGNLICRPICLVSEWKIYSKTVSKLFLSGHLSHKTKNGQLFHDAQAIGHGQPNWILKNVIEDS